MHVECKIILFVYLSATFLYVRSMFHVPRNHSISDNTENIVQPCSFSLGWMVASMLLSGASVLFKEQGITVLVSFEKKEYNE